jgi:predicted RNase H-like nuclease
MGATLGGVAVAVGVDACKSGWIAVAIDDVRVIEAQFLPRIDALPAVLPEASIVAIDIPIGLPESGRRAADVAARAFLGARRNSVFFTPVRPALAAATHAQASAVATRLTGFGLSQQSFALAAKILEVDEWATLAPCPVYEVHPEVSFAILLNAPASAAKKTWAGMTQRRLALERAGLCLDQLGGEAAVRAGVDDMLDAAVAAWSARRIVRGEAVTFPDPPIAGPDGALTAIWA